MSHLVFGRDRDPGVVESLPRDQGATRVRNGKGRWGAFKTNPLIAVFGPGPEGTHCATCSHLFARGDTAGTYHKCDLRPVTGGALTDHRMRWPTCGQYQPVEPEEEL